MEPTRELVDMARATQVLGGASLFALILSAVVLARGGRRAFSAGWARAAALGILAYPLWLLYNRIEDAFGLDSIAALLLNLALFSLIGVAAGLAFRRAARRAPSGAAKEE